MGNEQKLNASSRSSRTERAAAGWRRRGIGFVAPRERSKYRRTVLIEEEREELENESTRGGGRKAQAAASRENEPPHQADRTYTAE